jgi:hypothetical protein
MINRHTTRLSIVAALTFATTVGLCGCASNGPNLDLLGRPAAAPNNNLITEAEIDGARGTTAYEVIQQTRPIFLVSQIDLAPLTERQVYLNGVRLGGVDELRLIPASSISEIRFVRSVEGGGTGSGRAGGAILVVSKVSGR